MHMCVCLSVVCCIAYTFLFCPLYCQDVSFFGNATVKMCRLSAGALCVCVCVYVSSVWQKLCEYARRVTDLHSEG